MAKAAPAMRAWLSTGFDLLEDAIYVGLGSLLAAVTVSLLVTEISFVSRYIVTGRLSDNIVTCSTAFC